jgi:plasmid stabilization system protein ParE
VQDRPLEIRWLKRALGDLEAEAQDIARDSPAAARRVVGAIQRAVELPSHCPHWRPVAREFPGMRSRQAWPLSPAALGKGSAARARG